jgi:hypothetical protein
LPGIFVLKHCFLLFLEVWGGDYIFEGQWEERAHKLSAVPPWLGYQIARTLHLALK